MESREAMKEQEVEDKWSYEIKLAMECTNWHWHLPLQRTMGISRFFVWERLTGGGSDNERVGADMYHWSLVVYNKLELSTALFE